MTCFYTGGSVPGPVVANIRGHSRDFPGGAVVKNPPYNGGDAGSIPGQGTRIPHAMEQLSPHATTTELTRLN